MHSQKTDDGLCNFLFFIMWMSTKRDPCYIVMRQIQLFASKLFGFTRRKRSVVFRPHPIIDYNFRLVFVFAAIRNCRTHVHLPPNYTVNSNSFYDDTWASTMALLDLLFGSIQFCGIVRTSLHVVYRQPKLQIQSWRLHVIVCT